MKHLDAIRRNAERTAKKLHLDVEQVAGYADGTYRVEFKEPQKETRVAGFTREEQA